MLEDGLSQLERLAGARMRERLVVLYVDEHGNEEAGIDMGGLFKDFWNDLAALAFDPNFALFRATPDELLYPSPASALAHGEAEHLRLFAFVGRVLGKALFERVTVQPQFAHFFLSFMGGHYNYLHMFADLESLDAELHRNLMFLKARGAFLFLPSARKRNVPSLTPSSLRRDRALLHQDVRRRRVRPRAHVHGRARRARRAGGGAARARRRARRGHVREPLPVHRPQDARGSGMKLRPRRARFSSRRYINLVAKHHLVDRLQAQSRAFVRGLAEVVDPKWLRMFNEPELQVRASRRSRARARAALDARRPDPPPPAHPRSRRKVLISGVRARLDVDDLRKHARYSGGYTPLDKTVRRFWKVLETLEAEDGEKFLRFVTSCPRPPPLGFEALAPTFCLHRVPVRSDAERLPTASTCFNTLKLPTYSSESALRKGLLTSINSGAGFDLS